MIDNKYTSTTSNKAREITFLRILVAGMLLVIVLEGFVLLKTLGMEKTIVTPPTIEKSFWVSGTDVSKSYLEQMAYWYAGLTLNVTPTTGAYQREMFLKYAAPAQAGKLAAETEARLDFLKKNSASTMFSAQTLNADERIKKVAIIGDLDTFVGDKKVNTKHTIYVIGFSYINGRLYVSEFKETNEKDMFGVNANPAAPQ